MPALPVNTTVHFGYLVALYRWWSSQEKGENVTERRGKKNGKWTKNLEFLFPELSFNPAMYISKDFHSITAAEQFSRLSRGFESHAFAEIKLSTMIASHQPHFISCREQKVYEKMKL